MWIVTTDGFFSVVKNNYCGPDELAVRGRRKEDIERFIAATGVNAKVLVFLNADYRFRVQVPAQVWADYIAKTSLAIDYGNFKSEIAKRKDKQLLAALHEVWGAFRRMQP